MERNTSPATARFERIAQPEETGLDVPVEVYTTSRPRWIGTEGHEVGVIYVLLAHVQRNGWEGWTLIAAGYDGRPAKKHGLKFLNAWVPTRDEAFQAANIEVPEPT